MARDTLGARCRYEPADPMEQKASRAAGWIEYPLLQRIVNRSIADAGGQPVRRIVFSQVVPLFGINKRFIKYLEEIETDLPYPEALYPSLELGDQSPSRLGLQDPVEKVAFNGAVNLGFRERRARKQVLGSPRINTQN
jgi:hypothetical protein